MAVFCQERFKYGSLSKENFEIVPCFAFKEPRSLIIDSIIIGLFLGINLQFVSSGPMPFIWTYSALIAGVILCFCVVYTLNVERSANMTLLAFILFLGFCTVMALITFSDNNQVVIFLFRIASFLVKALCFAVSGYVAILLNKSISKGFQLGALSYVGSLAIGELIWLVWPWEKINLLVVTSMLLVISIIILLAGIVLKKQDVEQKTPYSLEALESDYNESSNSSITKLEDACNELSSKYSLTERESEILIPLARGYTLKTISENDVVSYNTVKAQVRSVYQKLGIHSRDELLSLIDRHN